MISKEHILSEIKRTADENDGAPLGRERFAKVTGVKTSDWYGRFWRNWGEALTEAGYQPNSFQSAYSEEFLIECLVKLIREHGRFPTHADIRIYSSQSPDFPSHTSFARLGKKPDRVQAVLGYCRDKEGFDDVVAACKPHLSKTKPEANENDNPIPPDQEMGFVYLMKSGGYYKIGRSNSVGRREYELGIQLPEPIETVHTIKTDDPVGIEAYWHQRFASHRVNGEWFKLDTSSVSAFRRRTFM